MNYIDGRQISEFIAKLDRHQKALLLLGCLPLPFDAATVKATFHLTIFMCAERATGKIQRNNYHHGSCGPSLTCETSSVSLIFPHGTHRNVKNR